ncbi:MAG: UDP-N-acetylglucosamine 2-epimerase (non-hydrolyzing) [Bacteroidales bacterium]|nr:UDP-N-acetylglucosamine 2-epimerase (non-hydrolyzing) [Bacteroidales bacterium]
MKILSVIGARPQFVKAATVSRMIATHSDFQEILLHTGQHYDENMSSLFFQELNIPEPDYNLNIGSGSHAWQTGKMLEGIEPVLVKEKPDWTLLYGDTNSTIAGALAATKLHIPVAHVEAGLRSFNRIMPEEINRIVTDRISDLLFAPTETAMNNLRNEGLAGITKFTGDVMYDSVLYYRGMIEKDPEMYSLPNLPNDFLLATIHRAENTDDPQQLENILYAFGQLPFPVMLPIHPRTKKMISGFTIPSNLRLIEPVGYLTMLSLILKAKKILTDSGGLQKEAYFLETPCITLRTETEWIETLHDGWNTLTATNPEKIIRAVELPFPEHPQKQAFGKGNAAEIILRLFTETC